jgi:hypothetical protein
LKREDGTIVGVAGTLAKLQDTQLGMLTYYFEMVRNFSSNVSLSGDQPVSGLDWSPDKTGLAVSTAFDQKIRILIVTKLNQL